MLDIQFDNLTAQSNLDGTCNIQVFTPLYDHNNKSQAQLQIICPHAKLNLASNKINISSKDAIKNLLYTKISSNNLLKTIKQDMLSYENKYGAIPKCIFLNRSAYYMIQVFLIATNTETSAAFTLWGIPIHVLIGDINYDDKPKFFFSNLI